MTTRVMGLETELGFGLTGAEDERKGSVLDRIMGLAGKRLSYLPGVHGSGMFLGNGSRFYIDTGGHPEFCTPEVLTPWELVRYVTAGDWILYEIAEEVMAIDRVPDVLFYKCHVDYTDFATWGCHENYSHKSTRGALPNQIVPHLVSRICLTGGGGLNPFHKGIEFCLSPRVCHLDSTSSNNSTGGRGIYHFKEESLGGRGWSRAHIICGESVLSHRAICLKAGTTALVVALVEGGLNPGDKVPLASPLEAMRCFNADPFGRATAVLVSGGERTALQIQRHYLEFTEAHLGHPCLPSWAPELCRLWRETLEMVAPGPVAASQSLDWAIKHSTYHDHIRRRGFTPEQLACWNKVLADLSPKWDAEMDWSTPLSAEALLSPTCSFRGAVVELEPRLRERGLSWDGVEHFLKLRGELCELEIRFARLGPKGLFNAFDAAGLLRHTLPEVSRESIRAAMTEPPTRGRAGVRGRLIISLCGQGRYGADWSGIWDFAGRRIDLSDPLAEAAPDWETAPAGTAPSFDPVGNLLAGLERRHHRGEYEAAMNEINILATLHPRIHRTAVERLLQITAWIQTRRGNHVEALAAADELAGRLPLDLGIACDFISAHRFNGLVPRPGLIEVWIGKGDEILVTQTNQQTSARFAFLGHKGAWLLQQRRLDEARAVLEESCRIAASFNENSRVYARNLCDLAEVHRLLGDAPAALAALDRAQQIQSRNHYDGDFAEFNLSRRAKIAADPRAAKSLLQQARLIQRRLRHTVGLAKTMLLQARLFPSIWHNQRRKRILLAWQRQVPALRDCPLLGRIMAHWDEWVSGQGGPGEDPFWRM